jgi:hypothetical protein
MIMKELVFVKPFHLTLTSSSQHPYEVVPGIIPFLMMRKQKAQKLIDLPKVRWLVMESD